MKRVLSLLLAIVMVFGLIPMAAFADGEPTISFETTFEDTMTVGDTFTVKASLANNPGVASMTVSLKWNEDVVKFKGFKTEYDEELEEDVLVTDVFKSVWEPVVNNELGIITAARSKDTKKTGTLFVANFEVVGYGELEIGLKNVDISEFQMKPAEGDNLVVTFDDAAISDLSVAAPEPEGPEIPTGAPFSAITTDVGPIVDITKESEVEVSVWGSGHPAMLYHVVLPEDAEYADVTMNIPLSGFTCDSDGNVSNYFGPVYGGEGGGSSFETVAFTATTTTIRVPMEVVDTWGTGEAYSLLKNEAGDYYVAGPQDASFGAICYFSFEYGEAGGEEEEIYSITIDENMVGGTLTAYNENQEEITEAKAGDYIFVTITPAEGYKGNSYTINGELANDVIFQMPEEDVILSATFTPIHTCSYTESDEDAKYLKSEATCQSGAVYYKSCTCGEFATTAETFVSGEKVDHDYVDGVCKWCGEAATEPILSFTAGGQTLEAVTAEDYCSEFEVTAQKLTVTVPAGVNTVTINCAASMCAYIDHVSGDLSPSGKSAEIDLTQDLTFVCVPVTLDDGSDAYYHVYFEQEAGDVDPEPEDPAVTPGYRFATSADVSAEKNGNAVVSVKITGHSDETVTSYNAYDVTLTFDTEKLEYVGFDGAVKADNGSVTVEGNTIRIVGCGADKDFGTEIAALTFKTKAEGNANVTISKVQVSDKEESVKEDAPEATPKHDEDDTTADTTPDQSVVLVPYTVSKPGFVSGATSVLHGKDYTFSYTDTVNYTYSGLKVTVGGTEVTPTVADGVYTVANVTGAVVIEATRTPNSYDVTKPANVTGPDKATYGEDYIFTVTPSEGKVIDTVTVTTANGSAIPYTINENGEYVIKGTDISGPFSIKVTEKDKPVTTTTITFTGVDEAEVVDGLTQTATIGQEFTFQLNKDEKFTYTAKVGETVLTETEGKYTIPAELVVEGGVTVNITKEEIKNLTVEVKEYISLDGKVMFLVTAKWDNKVLSYGEGNTMFWSSKYDAYCWLVLSTEEMKTSDLVKAAAEAAIVEAAEGVAATTIRYDYDVNGTTKVDVNDAQLAYDMYNASYMEFTANLPMLKFLEADMETDSKLDTKDVAAIISYIVNNDNA